MNILNDHILLNMESIINTGLWDKGLKKIKFAQVAWCFKNISVKI